MRIIAGRAKGTSLIAPKGLNTRPTADMAKESLFNIISTDIRDTHFLDLFCGSGAIGLEALSRGAKEAVFVESSRPAIAATMQNVEKTKLAPFAELLQMPAAKAIDKLAARGRSFDIIFLDPPYDTNLLTQTLNHLAKTNLLSKTGILIAETDSKINAENPILTPKELELINTRIYGRTCFLFYKIY